MDDLSDNIQPGVFLVPDPSPWPSLEVNNARYAPFYAQGEGPVDLGALRPSVAVEAPDRSTAFTPQGPQNLMASLRAQFPFLPIMPLPPLMRALALVANVAQELVIPNGAVVMNLQGSADYYLSLHGNAAVPSATDTGPASIGTSSESKAFKVSPGLWYFVGGLKAISCVAPAGCNITAQFYTQTEMPR